MSDRDNHETEAVPVVDQIVDIRDFRKKRGRDGITAVRLSDELVVGCSLTNMETLVLEKRIPEPLMAVALEIAGLNTTGKRNEALNMKKMMDTVRLQDVICGAIIRQPRWFMTEELERDANGDTIQPDGLCLADLSDEERAAVAQLIYGGLPALERFRARLRLSDNAVPDGNGVQEAPERDHDGDDGGLPPIRAVDVRPGDYDAGSGDAEAGAGEGQHQPTRLARVPGF